MIGIDLFAGAGGMSLGASMAGIAVEFAVELDEHAAKTYARNHPSTTLYVADIRTVTKKTLRPWIGRGDDLVVFGGPPCQGFSWSNAKTRNTSNEANWLFKEFIRIVKVLKPAWVVFENVQGIVDTAEGVFVEQLSDDLVSLDYSIHSAKLNASHFGVPQDRTRFFLVASRDGLPFKFPKPSREVLSVDDAIRDLPILANGDATCWRKYGRSHPTEYAMNLRNGLKGCCNHLVTRNAQFVVKRYAHVPQGGNWQDIPARLMKNYSDRSRCHTGIYHRLAANEPSVVIGNFRKNMLIHPTQDRGLSVREAARIQSFPDTYTFRGSIGFQQQQVGNAVPPYLARAVFQSLTTNGKRK
jgi:DNA (cytosine-5)-methyltransferase 1